ncbi:MAG: hemerythrin domain-containing protein [Mycobacterium sp.]
MDITDLILVQHHEQRRMFALLDDLADSDVGSLTAIWERLATFLEVHAAAEEKVFYPRLLDIGRGSPGGDGPQDETKDAIKDHNEIRDAVAAAADHQVGTEKWWAAVRAARVANSDHMAEEERDDLPDFRRHADLQTRHDIGVQFLVHQASHPDGVAAKNRDPQRYVDEHG